MFAHGTSWLAFFFFFFSFPFFPASSIELYIGEGAFDCRTEKLTREGMRHQGNGSSHSRSTGGMAVGLVYSLGKTSGTWFH